MPKSPILTLEQARRVGELRNQGLTLQVIATRFGVSPATIKGCLARLAAIEAGGLHRPDSAPFSEAGGAAAA
jgi:hypothetical protein